MQKKLLLDRVAVLIKRTRWAEDKQKIWLAKHDAMSWDDCSERDLQEAVTYLDRIDGMVK